jgi:hypothetical protein
MKSSRKTALALSAFSMALVFAQPAAAQVGDSKADPRSHIQGVADNENTSHNPVGVPHSTNAAQCASMYPSQYGAQYEGCMENMMVRSASTGPGMVQRVRERTADVVHNVRERTADVVHNVRERGSHLVDRASEAVDERAYWAQRWEGVSDHENTSANPNTGGYGYRGGDSGIAPQGGT